MHDTAYHIGSVFLETYGFPEAKILDVGAMNVNGSLRTAAPSSADYLGVDLAPGNGVDLVIEDPYNLPFSDNTFDLIVCSSCMEHDPMFWLSFLELARVTKPGGFIYSNVPSNGLYHTYPIDAWRCYPDAGLALEIWAQRQGQGVELIESFVAPQVEVMWNDFVMIFGKLPLNHVGNERVVDKVAGAMNIRTMEEPGLVKNKQIDPEDLRIIKALKLEVVELKKRNAEFEQTLSQHLSSAAAVLGRTRLDSSSLVTDSAT